jgi:hypothetical protein
MRVAQRAAFVTAVLGVTLGALFLFAPIQGYCTQTIGASSGQASPTPGPTTCGYEALWQQQPIFPMPFFAVLVWSLAPLATYFGVTRRLRGDPDAGNVFIGMGLALELTVLVSFGAAPYFAPFVLLPVIITSVLALRSRPMG